MFVSLTCCKPKTYNKSTPLRESKGEIFGLAIRAPSPTEMVDVFAAWVHALRPEQADAVASRAIIVDDAVTLEALATSRQRLILIAGPRLETTQ